jgi:alpha-ketoglutarate-dependent taurine dioxygenase
VVARDRDLQSRSIIDLDAKTKAALEGLAQRPESDPYRNFEGYFAEARFAAGSLPAGLVAAVTDFANKGNVDGALLIRGLDLVEKIPPTPTVSVAGRVTTGASSEFIMCVLAAALGDPIGYREERGGQIFHDVFPTPENEHRLSSQSSSEALGYHTEMAFHVRPPDYLLLYALRSDPDGVARTSFSSSRRVLGDLPTSAREALFRPDYMLELGRLHSPYRSGGTPIQELDEGPWVSVLYGDPADPFLRYEPELMRPRHRVAADAVSVLAEALDRHGRAVALRAGQALILDNRRSAHARSPFRAAYDGQDRWIRRMHVVRTLPRGVDRVVTADLAEARL